MQPDNTTFISSTWSIHKKRPQSQLINRILTYIQSKHPNQLSYQSLLHLLSNKSRIVRKTTQVGILQTREIQLKMHLLWTVLGRLKRKRQTQMQLNPPEQWCQKDNFFPMEVFKNLHLLSTIISLPKATLILSQSLLFSKKYTKPTKTPVGKIQNNRHQATLKLKVSSAQSTSRQKRAKRAKYSSSHTQMTNKGT